MSRTAAIVTVLALEELIRRNGTANAPQVANLIRSVLELTDTELFVNKYDEIVVAQGYDEVVL